jgi:hypothetical protein
MEPLVIRKSTPEDVADIMRIKKKQETTLSAASVTLSTHG